jgi:hypothetical protein
LAAIAPLSEGQDREEKPAASCGPKIAIRKKRIASLGAWKDLENEVFSGDYVCFFTVSYGMTIERVLIRYSP